MTEKIYCGNGKVIATQYGDMMKLSLTAENVEILQQNLNNGWVNLNVKKRREPSAGGMTHYLEVDKWKPEESKPKNPADNLPEEELPF